MDLEKTKTIWDMDVPKSVSEVRRFLGMVNQLGKFSSNIANLTQRKHGYGALIKTLAHYNPEGDLKLSADASSYGLGPVLFQCELEFWKPVVFASRSMSETELRYAQIEQEALATTWACEKLADYLLGRKFTIESDHKPLIPLLNSKQLDSLPPRVLRFRLRLARFNYNVVHVPGKDLNLADTVSRAPVRKGQENEVSKHSIPATHKKAGGIQESSRK